MVHISVGFDARHLALISHRYIHILGTSCHFSVQYSVDNSGNVFSRFSTEARCKTTCKYFCYFPYAKNILYRIILKNNMYVSIANIISKLVVWTLVDHILPTNYQTHTTMAPVDNDCGHG